MAECALCGHHRDFHQTTRPTWCLHAVVPGGAPDSGDCDCPGFEPTEDEENDDV